MTSVVHINEAASSTASKEDRTHIVWNHAEKLSITRTFMRLYGNTLKGVVVAQAMRVVQDTCAAENTLDAHRVRTSIPGAASFPWFAHYVELVKAEQRAAAISRGEPDPVEEDDANVMPVSIKRTMPILPVTKIRNFDPAAYSSVGEFYDRNIEFIRDNVGRFTLEQASSIVNLLTGSFGSSLMGSKKVGPIVVIVSDESYYEILVENTEQSCKPFKAVFVDDIRHNADVLSEASEIFSIENEGRQFDFPVTHITFGDFIKRVKKGC